MRWLPVHLSVAVLLLSMPAPAATQDSTSTFTVMVRGVRIGSETVTITETPDGRTIRASSRLNPPIDIVTTRFELSYDREWRPRSLSIEGTYRGGLFTMTSSMSPAGASSTLMLGGQQQSATQAVPPDAVFLPDNFFAPYEALAARVLPLQAGGTVPIFVVPEAMATATVDRIGERLLSTPDGMVDIREYSLTFQLEAGPMPVNLWIDGEGRLARVVLPRSSIVAVRDDISSVLSREVVVDNPTDETLFIPASGFNLGATITKPVDGNPDARPVILVSGFDEADRERQVSGVPIYGQLAGQLADAGFFVVRYDRRGLGQSGGRIESATVEVLADDIREIVRWLRRRDDVDADRVALVSHGQSAAVALLATRREGRVKALGLLAAPAGSGVEVTLEQQRRELEALPIDDEDRAQRIALQRAIIDAVLTGNGWDSLPNALRRQADTPLFRSWLEFSTADVVDRIDEPMLILRGALDQEVIASDADRLEQLSEARNRAATFTRRTALPGLNHLLTPASTGSPAEYAVLPDPRVSPLVGSAIAEWLNQVMPPRR